MAEFYHGVRATQQQVEHEAVRECESGIPFVVGTAPVHTVDGKVNYPVLCASFADAEDQLGYSDDWESYTLCEFMYSHFKNYGAQPVVFVNVLDPSTAQEEVTGQTVDLTDGIGSLPLDAIASTVVVTYGEETLTQGTDYELYYDFDDGVLYVQTLEGGAAEEATQLSCDYSQVTPSSVTKEDILGGRDTTTGLTTGFELLEYVYHLISVAPDLLVSPFWSTDPEVATVMAAKAENINCVFRGLAIVDIDTEAVPNYELLEDYKADNKLTDTNMVLCWPMNTYEGRTYHLATTFCGTAAITDIEEGHVPCASPSNMAACIDSLVTADGTEVLLNINEAARVNNMGVVTGLKFSEGYTIWGDQTAGWPEETDPQNGSIAGNRMFDFVCNNLIIKTWAKVDKRMNRRLIQGIMDKANTWLNGLTADEKILGGRVEFEAADNTAEQLNSGILTYRVYLGIAPTARDIEYIVQQDLSYLEAVIAELAS